MSKLIGAFIGVVVDVIGHLLAAIIEKQSFFDQLISIQGIMLLVVLILVGLLAGVLLEKSDHSTSNPDGINVRGLKSLRSTLNLKGARINVRNSKMVDSDHTYDNR